MTRRTERNFGMLFDGQVETLLLLLLFSSATMFVASGGRDEEKATTGSDITVVMSPAMFEIFMKGSS
jgi:hypothetical protein